MISQRYCIEPVVYVHTRTARQMRLDVEAWVASWQLPASMIIGTGKKDGKGNSGQPSSNVQVQKPTKIGSYVDVDNATPEDVQRFRMLERMRAPGRPMGAGPDGKGMPSLSSLSGIPAAVAALKAGRSKAEASAVASKPTAR